MAAARATFLATLQQERISAAVEAILQAADAPGASVAIVYDQAQFAQGYGVRALGSDAPVDADTLFVCASTTKAFTTALIAGLVDEGRMGWDDPVRKWLPGFRLSDPHADALVTVRDLVTHRTGLPRHDALWYHSGLDADEVLRRAAFAPFSASFRGKYQYQNLCYIAAGRVAVAVTGADDLESLLQSRLLEPLGMTRSPLTFQGMQADPNCALPHQRIKGQVQVTPPVNFGTVEAAGALHSSARQMLNWLHFHVSGGLAPNGVHIIGEDALRETYRAQMVQPVDAETRTRYPTCDSMTYGLGWSSWQYPLWGVRGNRAGIGVVSHSGYLDGFRAHVALIPSEKIGVAVFANLSAPLIESLRSALLDILLDLAPDACPDWPMLVRGDIEKAEEEKNKKESEQAEKRKVGLPVPLPLSAFSGHYTHLAYGDAEVAQSGDELTLSWNTHHTSLRHEQFTTFTATTDRQPLEAETVRFTLGADGAVTHLTLWDTALARADALPATAEGDGEPIKTDAPPAADAASKIEAVL